MLQFKQIIEGLSLRPKVGFFGYSSVTLVRDGDENVLFDTGGYGVRSALIELLRDVKIHKVFISHLHFDHCANVSLFKNSTVYIHQCEIDFLHSAEAGSSSIYSDINDFMKSSLDQVKLTTFSKEEHLTENTKIIFTPGHTSGHSSLELLSQEKRIVIAGDAIETFQEYLEPSRHSDCFGTELHYATRKILKKNYDIIIPGHSSMIEDGRLKDPSVHLRYF